MSERTDFSRKYGAEQLADTIRRYWRRRGHDYVKVEIVPLRDVFVVRSNMVNGIPTRRRLVLV